MKSIVSILILSIISIHLNAQKITITNVSENLGGSYNPALQISIPHANTKTVEKKWNSFLKDYRAKVKTSKDEIVGHHFVLKATDTLEVFSRITESADGVTLTASFSRDGIFISAITDQTDFDMLSKLIHDMALPIAKDGLDEKIDDAAGAFEGKTKEHDNLIKSNERLQKDNEKMKSRISDNEREINDNEKKIRNLNATLEQQKSGVDEIKSKKKDLE